MRLAWCEVDSLQHFLLNWSGWQGAMERAMEDVRYAVDGASMEFRWCLDTYAALGWSTR